MGVLEETRERLSELPYIEEREKSLAKVSKAINRIRRLGQEERVELALEQLNLRLHLDEVLGTLIEVLTSLKMKDIDKFIAIVVSLHLSYKAQVLQSVEEAAVALIQSASADLVKKRLAVRVLAELASMFPSETKSVGIMSTFLVSLVSTGDLGSLTTLNSFISRFPADVFPSVHAALERKLAGEEATTAATKWRTNVAEEVRKAEEAASRMRISAGALDDEMANKLKDARNLVSKVDSQINTLLEYLGRATTVVGTASCSSSTPVELSEVPVFEDEVYQRDTALVVTETPTNWTAEEQTEFMREFENIRDVVSADMFVSGRAKEVSKSTMRWLVTRMTRADAMKWTSEKRPYSKSKPGRRRANREVTVYQMRAIATIALNIKELQSLLVAEATTARGKTMTGKSVSGRELELIGELTKFQVLPARFVLEILEDLISGGGGSQLELAAVLLQNCGRHLLANADTKAITEAQLERIWRFKHTKYLPEHVETAIEDVYYMLKPEKLAGNLIGASRSTEPTELELFLEHLLSDPNGISDPAALFEKLQACAVEDEILTRRMLLGLRFPAPSVVHVAAALGQQPRSEFVVKLVDELFESVQKGLETDDPLMAAHRYREAVFVSELFMEQVVNFDCILDFIANLLGMATISQHEARKFRREPVRTLQQGASLAPISEEQAEVESEADFRMMKYCHPQAPMEREDSFLRARMVYKTLEIVGSCVMKERFKELNRLGVLLQASLFSRSEFPNDLRLQILNLLENLGLAVAQSAKEVSEFLSAPGGPPTRRPVGKEKQAESKVVIVDPREKQPLLEEQKDLDAQLAELMGENQRPTSTAVQWSTGLEYEGVRILARPTKKETSIVVPEGLEMLIPKRHR
jgi:hypothetical protein